MQLIKHTETLILINGEYRLCLFYDLKLLNKIVLTHKAKHIKTITNFKSDILQEIIELPFIVGIKTDYESISKLAHIKLEMLTYKKGSNTYVLVKDWESNKLKHLLLNVYVSYGVFSYDYKYYLTEELGSDVILIELGLFNIVNSVSKELLGE